MLGNWVFRAFVAIEMVQNCVNPLSGIALFTTGIGLWPIAGDMIMQARRCHLGDDLCISWSGRTSTKQGELEQRVQPAVLDVAGIAPICELFTRIDDARMVSPFPYVAQHGKLVF